MARRKELIANFDLIDVTQVENYLNQMVANLTTFPTDVLRRGGVGTPLDPRRNLNADCGYPESGSVGADGYKELYQREPVAARAVELMPKECWQISPTIFETDDEKRDTAFEKAWDELELSISAGASWHQMEEGSAIWEYLQRADVLSGIGSFGVLLLGFDDGKNLQDPVEGAVMEMDNPQPYANSLNPRWQPALPDSWLTEQEENALLNPMPRKVWAGGYNDKGQPVYNEIKPPAPNENETRIITLWRAMRERYEGEARKAGVSNEQFITNKIAHSSEDLLSGQDQLYDRQLGQPKPMGEGVLAGTDQQYFAPIQGPSETPATTPAKKKCKLLFLRAFDESLVQVVRYEWNIRNPRFGLPVMYRITLNDPREMHSGVGLPLATVYVHWSRVIHIADVNHQAGSSEIFAAPRLRPILNPILDIMKVTGSSAEGYWQSCFEKLSFETIPQLGGDVDIDESSMQDLFENIQNSLQRAWHLRGMTAKAIAPSVIDPSPWVNVQIERVCIKLNCPVPVFKGYEIGEQASENNDKDWNDRVRQRQMGYLIPRVIVPFVDRLITVGALPEPAGYQCDWRKKDEISEKDKAAIGLTRTQALAAYVTGQVESIIPPKEFMVSIMNMEDNEAENMVDAAAKATESDMHTMPAPGEPGHPATVPPPKPPPPAAPIKVKPGETLVHPDSVQPPGGGDNEPKPPKEPATNRAELEWRRYERERQWEREKVINERNATILKQEELRERYKAVRNRALAARAAYDIAIAETETLVASIPIANAATLPEHQTFTDLRRRFSKRLAEHSVAPDRTGERLVTTNWLARELYEWGTSLSPDDNAANYSADAITFMEPVLGKVCNQVSELTAFAGDYAAQVNFATEIRNVGAKTYGAEWAACHFEPLPIEPPAVNEDLEWLRRNLLANGVQKTDGELLALIAQHGGNDAV